MDRIRQQDKIFVEQAIEYQNKLLDLTPMLEELVRLKSSHEGAQKRIKQLEDELRSVSQQMDVESANQHSTQRLLRVSEMLERQALKADVPAKLHFTDEEGLVPLVAHSVLEFNMRFNRFKESLAQFQAIGIHLNAGHFTRGGDEWLKKAKSNPYWLVPMCNVLALSDAVYRKYADKMRIFEYLTAGSDEPSYVVDEWLSEVAMMDTESGFESWRSRRSRLLLSTFSVANITDSAIDIQSAADGTFAELLSQVPTFRFDAALALDKGGDVQTAYSNNPFKLNILNEIPHCDNGLIEGQVTTLTTHSAILDEFYNKESTHVLKS
tara:strand:+ start:160711 stop:161679 length:969 start_codon:yes stop_codon:yes gene_type:complete